MYTGAVQRQVLPLQPGQPWEGAYEGLDSDLASTFPTVRRSDRQPASLQSLPLLFNFCLNKPEQLTLTLLSFDS